MAVAIDYSRRLYLVISMDETGDHVELLERGSAGPDELHRRPGTQEIIDVRTIPFKSVEKSDGTIKRGFEDLFDLVDNVSGGELVGKWMEANHWQVSPAALSVIRRVLYIEDTVMYLQDRASRRNPENALHRASIIRKKARHHEDDSIPKKYNFKKTALKKKFKKRSRK